MYQY